MNVLFSPSFLTVLAPNSTLEAEEYVYTFLRNFPENTFALPQVFRKVVKGLNSSHWLAKKVDELKNRRWRLRKEQDDNSFGRLSNEEVQKIREGNPAFWECFMQKKPPQEVLEKKMMQYERKTANVKQARTEGPMAPTTVGVKREATNSSNNPKSAKLSKKTRIVSRAAAAANRTHTSPMGYTELIDPTAVDLLEEIVQNNPVLFKIRECGVKAKREDVYPTSVSERRRIKIVSYHNLEADSTLQAETYVYTYLKNFPENTFALPPTFRKVVRGLNASHWLAKKVIEMKDRRWRLKEGQESEYGRMSVEEVEKIKECNTAFWELYINKRPPQDILNKKRKQYARKTENNKSSRATKKPKGEGEDGEKEEEHYQNTKGGNVETNAVPEMEFAAPDGLAVAAPEPLAQAETATEDTDMVYSRVDV
eukprot:scaffold34695_cov266-Amphora_coffeaeformis.AAC.4